MISKNVSHNRVVYIGFFNDFITFTTVFFIITRIKKSIDKQKNRMLRRERLSSALKNQQYIPQLLDVFQKAEDIEDETALKSLYEIFKAIWMLNQGEIYEILFNQKYIFVSG